MTVRLFVDVALERDFELQLPAAAARHVQVRRLQPGDRLRLFNSTGGEWHAAVVHMGRSEVTVRVEAFDSVERELPVRVTLALGMPANERMDILVEKATELGVHSIQPLLCERSVLRLAADRAQRKREHWQAIAAAASEQCGRTRVPRVAPVLLLERWLKTLEGDASRVLLCPREDAPALHVVAGHVMSLITLSGPEGGLTAAEEGLAMEHGFVAARLGERVLRAETAPLAVLAWIGLNPHVATMPRATAMPATDCAQAQREPQPR
jgi:16S rRNA (uracil1498-N3)-methyltransferase